MNYSFYNSHINLTASFLALLPTTLSNGALEELNNYLKSHSGATQYDIIGHLHNQITGTANTNNIQHEDLYVYVFSQITEEDGTGGIKPRAGVEASSWKWVEGAIGVNTAAENFFSEFIREYTVSQYQIRYDTTLDGSAIMDLVQDASDGIALSFIDDILSGHTLPSIQDIGEYDAGNIAATVFDENSADNTGGTQGNYSPWAGTILFPFLGVDSFTSDWLLTDATGSNKKISGTYDLVSVAQAAFEVSDILSAVGARTALLDVLQNNNIGETETLLLLENLRTEANVFFQNAYGLNDIEIYRIGSDLPLYGEISLNGLSYYNRPLYTVGKLTDDALIITEDNKEWPQIVVGDLSSSLENFLNLISNSDIVNAGLGNDIIRGSMGYDVIDGHDGTDTLTYNQLDVGINVNLTDFAGGIYTDRIEVSFDALISGVIKNMNDFTDYIYSIENLVLTNHDDTLYFDDVSDWTSTITIKGGGGTDILDFTAMPSTGTMNEGVTVDMFNGTIGTLNFESFEEVHGSDYNDLIYGGAGQTVIKGGDGSDTLDYSQLSLTGIVVDIDNVNGMGTVTKMSAEHPRGVKDQFVGVENFFGTDGADFFRGKEGVSGLLFDGGTQGANEKDVLDFSNYNAGVNVNLTTGIATDNSTAVTYVSGFEQVNGSNGHDVITGAAQDEWLYGEGGNDTINGADGDDRIFGGEGTNQLYGGEGNDSFIFDEDADSVSFIHDTDATQDDIDMLYFDGEMSLNIASDIASVGGGEYVIEGVARFTAGDIELIKYSDGVTFALENLIRSAPSISSGVLGNTIYDSPYNDVLNGTAGDDVFFTGAGSDTINGGDGFDAVSYSNSAGVYVNLTTGVTQGKPVYNPYPTLTGFNGQDSLSSIERVEGSNYVDLLVGDSNTNHLNGLAGNDTIDGQGGNDIIYDLNGANLVYGGDGHDWIFATGLVYGGNGSDHIEGAGILVGDAGEDFIFANDHNTTLDGGADNDYLYSSSNNTVYVVGYGLDAVRDAGAGGVLWVQNGDINNTTYYQADNGSLIIESGSAVIVAVDHFNGAGISGISFDNGANVYTIPTDGIQFYQDEYDNSFQSTSGDDVYYADEHNDAYISSTRGDNIFHFTQSVSATTTINSYGAFAHSETLVLDGVTSTDDVQLIRYSDRPNEIVVKFGADGQIILQGEDFVSQTQIEIDGQSYALSAFDFITQGTPDTDNYYRSNQTLNIEGDFSGFSIDDVMYGGFGDDGMLGHDGNDALYGEGGMDSIVGGNGNDTIDGGDDDDTIDGNAGSDLYIDSHGNDTYYMSTGDTLVAGSGENTVLTSDTDLSGALIDLSQYGYVLEDNTVILGFVRDVSGFLNDDYVIHYAGNEITLDNYDEYTLAPTIKLADDSTASLSSLAVEGIGSDNMDFFNEGNFNITLNDILYMGDGDDGIILTAGDDTVYGQGGGDTITKEGGTGALIAYGGDGNDIITDGTGDDVIDAGADNDYVFAYYGGNDTIDAGAGDDTVNIALLGSGAVDGGEGTDIFSLIHLPTYNQTISFTEIDLDAGEVTTSLGTYTIANFETIYTANHDTLFIGNDEATLVNGNGGNDTYQGNGGDDTLYGAGGDDTYIWSEGDGNDYINDTSSANDKLVFNDKTFYALTFNQQGANLEITSNSSSETLVANGIDNFVFSDGTSMSSSELSQYLSTSVVSLHGSSQGETLYANSSDDHNLYGGAGNDTLIGNTGDDILHGNDGDDVLQGGNGNDQLYGGDGFDELYGQSGADDFIFEAISAFNDIDSINDFDTSSGDRLDLSDLIQGFDPLTDAINDFVQITDNGTDSSVFVDVDGGADNFVQVATITNVTGLTDEDQLYSNGNIIL